MREKDTLIRLIKEIMPVNTVRELMDYRLKNQNWACFVENIVSSRLASVTFYHFPLYKLSPSTSLFLKLFAGMYLAFFAPLAKGALSVTSPDVGAAYRWVGGMRHPLNKRGANFFANSLLCPWLFDFIWHYILSLLF